MKEFEGKLQGMLLSAQVFCSVESTNQHQCVENVESKGMTEPSHSEVIRGQVGDLSSAPHPKDGIYQNRDF